MTKQIIHPKVYHLDQEQKYPFWEVCACCGTQFEQNQLGLLSNAIMHHKPVCSYECNQKLGQVK